MPVNIKLKTIAKDHAHAIELERLQIRIQMDLQQAERDREKAERLDAGLTALEIEYKSAFEEIQQAVILLALAVEYKKSERIINREARTVAAKREIVDSIKRKMFKICLKTGLECNV